MRESALERKVVAYCKSHGLLCYKFVSPGNRGVPDRLILGRGKVLFLELKAPGSGPTTLQNYEAAQIFKAGFQSCWSDNFEQAKSVIDHKFDVV